MNDNSYQPLKVIVGIQPMSGEMNGRAWHGVRIHYTQQSIKFEGEYAGSEYISNGNAYEYAIGDTFTTFIYQRGYNNTYKCVGLQ